MIKARGSHWLTPYLMWSNKHIPTTLRITSMAQCQYKSKLNCVPLSHLYLHCTYSAHEWGVTSSPTPGNYFAAASSWSRYHPLCLSPYLYPASLLIIRATNFQHALIRSPSQIFSDPYWSYLRVLVKTYQTPCHQGPIIHPLRLVVF